jgi:trk system potassium uptake protein TrkA
MFSKTSSYEKIVILGLGGVGFYLAKRLVREGHEVTVIEADSKLIRYADGNIDARLIRGDAMSLDCWKEVNVEKTDLVIAVTNNDALNILASMIADRFGIRRKIARVRSLDFGEKGSILRAEDFKIDLFIYPEELAAQEIVRLVKRTAGNEIIGIAQEQMQVMGIRIQENSPLARKKLKEISRIYDDFPFRVVTIARGINTIIPSGEHEILPQDQIFIMAGRENLPQLMELTGVKQQSLHKVMILGGGLVGSRVAELLGKSVEVKLIEHNDRTAEELSFMLKNVEILHGDGSHADTLALAGLLDMDTFIATTGDNETNIISCLLAKHLMNKENHVVKTLQGKTIALVNNEDYLTLASTIGLDIALNAKILAGNEILKFIRRGELLSVAHLHGVDTEIIELVAAPNAPITQKPLAKITDSFDGSFIIGGVFRDGKWEIGVGGTHIHDNERIILACNSLQLQKVQQLFVS